MMKNVTSKTSTTPNASRLCARLGDRFERIKSCASGAALFTIGANSSQRLERLARSSYSFATLVTCCLSSRPVLSIGTAHDEQGSVAASEQALDWQGFLRRRM